jgi:hypothetical protein
MCIIPVSFVGLIRRFEKHMDILFMITHDGNFNTAIQALILIYQVAIAKQVSHTLEVH